MYIYGQYYCIKHLSDIKQITKKLVKAENLLVKHNPYTLLHLEFIKSSFNKFSTAVSCTVKWCLVFHFEDFCLRVF